jgi:hypothetical protein
MYRYTPLNCLLFCFPSHISRAQWMKVLRDQEMAEEFQNPHRWRMVLGSGLFLKSTEEAYILGFCCRVVR